MQFPQPLPSSRWGTVGLVRVTILAPSGGLRLWLGAGPGERCAVEGVFRCARTGYGGHRAGVKGLAALRADRHGCGDVPAGSVLGLHGRAAGCRPSVAPLPHGHYHVPQVAALGGEPVFRARRVIGVGDPLEDFVVDEVVQTLGEDVTGDSEAGLKIIEARDAEEGVPDDEQAPPFPYEFQALSDRAVHVLKAGALHELSIEGCVMERTPSRVSSMRKLVKLAGAGA